jgi:hypothetical protein
MKDDKIWVTGLGLIVAIETLIFEGQGQLHPVFFKLGIVPTTGAIFRVSRGGFCPLCRCIPGQVVTEPSPFSKSIREWDNCHTGHAQKGVMMHEAGVDEMIT